MDAAGNAPTPRVAARVILIDRAGRTLLFRGGDPHRPEAGTWWFTPGGGLDPGETVRQAAHREVLEETGFVVDVVGDPVRVRRTRFEFEGSTYDQLEHFFVARLEATPPDGSGLDGSGLDGSGLDDSRWTDVERRTIVGHRWWTLAELRGTTQTFYPEDLADLLAEILAEP